MSFTQGILSTIKTHCDYGPIGIEDSHSLLDFQIQEGFLHYLDHHGHLEEIEQSALNYLKVVDQSQRASEIAPPFRFIVNLDFSLLAGISGLASNALLNDPLGTRTSLHKVVFHTLRVLGNLPSIPHCQVEVLLRPISLPQFDRPIGNDHGLVCLQGILLSRTTVKKYVQSSYFSCPCDTCFGSIGKRMPGITLETGKPICFECGLGMEEQTRARVLGDQVIGVIVDARAFQMGEHKRYQGVYVSFQDELTSDLDLGVRYEITGYRSPNAFHAWSVRRWSSSSAVKLINGLPIVLPPSIASLRTRFKEEFPNSPWVFVAAIASQLAFHLFPTSALLNAKMGLLLSLASLGGENPVPILGIGADTCSAHSLMSFTARLAPRCVTMQSCLPVGGWEKGEDGVGWLEAGALLLATTGVCYVGDWAKYRLESQRAPIIAAVESKTVTLNGSSSNPSATSTTVYPLKATVWTYWPRDTKTDNQPANQKQLKTLVHVFGMPFLTDPGPNEEEVLLHILRSSITRGNLPQPPTAIPFDELREFVGLAIARHVELGERASKLIQEYFVASRKVRPNCLPVGAIATITALSEAHARLSLRDTVTCADVLAVLCLYENTIANLYGESYFTSPPSYNLHCANQVDQQMGEFASWLETYIKSVIGDGFSRMS